MRRLTSALPAINYRLVAEDILYIFTHADVDAVIVDREYASHLNSFRRERPLVEVIEDVDSDIPGPFDDIVQTGWDFDMKNGNKGWDGLDVHPESEHDLIALAYTSGTTAKPKGVEFLHRGAYLASLAHVSEYGLTSPKDTCRFLWTLPMFHAMGLLPILLSSSTQPKKNPLFLPNNLLRRQLLTIFLYRTRVVLRLGGHRRQRNTYLPPQD